MVAVRWEPPQEGLLSTQLFLPPLFFGGRTTVATNCHVLKETACLRALCSSPSARLARLAAALMQATDDTFTSGPVDTSDVTAVAQREYENELLFKLCADEIEELRRQVKTHKDRADEAANASVVLERDRAVEEQARASEAETLRRLAKERADALNQAKLELGRVRAQYRTEKRRANALQKATKGADPPPQQKPRPSSSTPSLPSRVLKANGTSRRALHSVTQGSQL